MKPGLSGVLTRAFINSPLTPLLLLAALVAGALAVFSLPREEEPQISVPMVDIMVVANGYKADAAYFKGDLPLDQLARRAREVASGGFMGSPECQAFVQSAFQRAAEAKLAGKAHSLDAEKKLLTALAAVRSEFGPPERYRNEGWKAGRE